MAPVNLGAVVFLISETFIILTIAAYLYVRELRNTLGKSVISCLFSIFMWQALFFVQMSFSVPKMFILVSFIFFLAHNLWLSVISYHLWRTFKPVNGEEPRFLFLTYNVYVWVPAAVLPGLIYIFAPLTDIGSKIVLCACVELFLANFFNLTMFILTINHILKLKRQTVKLRQGDGETTTCLNLDSVAYLHCLRILFVIGLHWLTLILCISPVLKFRHPVVDVIFGFIGAGYGIWYFILLILNRSTLRLLMDRFRGSPKKQFVRAQRVKSPA